MRRPPTRPKMRTWRFMMMLWRSISAAIPKGVVGVVLRRCNWINTGKRARGPVSGVEARSEFMDTGRFVRAEQLRFAKASPAYGFCIWKLITVGRAKALASLHFVAQMRSGKVLGRDPRQ